MSYVNLVRKYKLKATLSCKEGHVWKGNGSKLIWVVGTGKSVGTSLYGENNVKPNRWSDRACGKNEPIRSG